jgi:DNA-binding transcriptional ArsR family regulator
MDETSLDDEQLATALRALGHPVRLSIMRILAQKSQDCCCTDVTQCLPLAQSTVSQHIKVLLDAGLIERQARGTRNCYSLRTDRLAALDAGCSGLLGGLSTPGRARRSTEPA